MELQFQNKPLDCLQSVLCGVKSQEQTQEVKLPEAMPDVGRVLSAWGQPVLRSKEWHGSLMGASGGVMVWVLYAPEDGTFPRVVEAWLPYQLHWELPQTQRDGAMIIRPLLRSVDARALSARKLMVRVCVDAVGEALEPVRVDIYQPAQLPENICLLRRKYPVCVPVEAGEKTFTLEEELQLPPECADAGKLIRYSLQPQIQEQKRLGDKLLFRGTALLQGLCRCPDDRLWSFKLEVPFSQYSELERECGDDAAFRVVPVVTDLELDLLEDGKLRLKASMVGQYLVCDRRMLELVEDAYSPGAQVRLQTQTLQLPTVLETRRENLQAEAEQELPAHGILDVAFRAGQPEQYRAEGEVQLQLAGGFQVLWQDAEKTLQSAMVKWEQKQMLPANGNTGLCCALEPVGAPDAAQTGDSVRLRAEMALERMVTTLEEIPVVTGLEISEPTGDTKERPSLILRRPGSDSLWNIAKQYGSTEEAIRQANGLTEDPAPDRMLLIPVI